MRNARRPRVAAREFFEKYVEALNEDQLAGSQWEEGIWEAHRWTEVTTRAAVAAIKSIFQNHGLDQEMAQVAAQGDPDIYGVSEYFTLDVVGYMDDYTAPLIA